MAHDPEKPWQARHGRICRAFIALFLIAIIVAGTLNALGIPIRRDWTPFIAASKGHMPVASLERINIGGVEQSVLIRGHDQTKPVILFLHGGPGMPAMFLAHAFQRDLEKDFVVVHWDRRGAGKSYAARDKGPPPTIRQTLNDTYELTNILRRRFHQQRIYLVGHSWGSALGLLAVSEHPEFYHAYVGMGQLSASTAETATARRGYFTAEATRRGDEPMLHRLRQGGVIEEDDLFKYGVELYGKTSFWPLLWLGLQSPEYSYRDIMNVPKGSSLLLEEMKGPELDRPLDEQLTSFKVPIFFLLGRHDWNTPSILAARYLNRIEAPAKGLIWFNRSAHFPFLEEPELFRAAMLRIDRITRKGPEASAPEPFSSMRNRP